tara:strand:- start:113 stop:325 length:213 start_codon:yes stop_codon:yes gene_type:complete
MERELRILRWANLQGADLDGADLREAKLHQADLRKATKLTDARLVRAMYDEGTKWPDGFDPQKHGAVRVE